MRTLIALLAIVLLTVAGHAQDSGKGRRHKAEPKTKVEDLAKKKAIEEDYNNALKTIPASTEKPDPWKSMR